MAGDLNLLKLCVGAAGPEDLLAWQSAHFRARAPEHVTRMWPKRGAELLDGGSLYWVFKGMVLARQRLLGLDERRGADGVLRCALVLDPEIVRTRPMPRRPFQGWRYLAAADAPEDLPAGREAEPELPDSLAAELAQMGLR
ncbi:DUF1489 family protein [Phaeovulum vinaykumarii]|uniref:DUF1489 family protein n=1 Tax=Phaeovulum vinaykumarii TaxID=407234 RepID=A0A1N7MEX5_9RHOB|nr:DUF1489 domain-containing protein [Phaeovulum vinaykumarii]SIS84519.1 hypothetical protein SAMN05421795_10726 [Phaeovulum vinaykumarii]SOC11811.1 hypothetical protein SAMN05878426_10726 [Phaeovulum vinaykumarii]